MKRRGNTRGGWEEGGRCGGSSGEVKELLCDVLKFWSGKFLHLLLWAGSDSVISMIGLNPGRVKETE